VVGVAVSPVLGDLAAELVEDAAVGGAPGEQLAPPPRRLVLRLSLQRDDLDTWAGGGRRLYDAAAG